MVRRHHAMIPVTENSPMSLLVVRSNMIVSERVSIANEHIATASH